MTTKYEPKFSIGDVVKIDASALNSDDKKSFRQERVKLNQAFKVIATEMEGPEDVEVGVVILCSLSGKKVIICEDICEPLTFGDQEIRGFA